MKHYLTSQASLELKKEEMGKIEISGSDLFTGVFWIIIASFSTLRVGLESILLWLATIVIWIYILRVSLQKEEMKKNE